MICGRNAATILRIATQPAAMALRTSRIVMRIPIYLSGSGFVGQQQARGPQFFGSLLVVRLVGGPDGLEPFEVLTGRCSEGGIRYQPRQRRTGLLRGVHVGGVHA